jgi:hypothetical protein
MRYKILTLLLVLPAMALLAQDGQSAFGFLRLPASPYIAALGGTNVSLVTSENSIAYQNPALLSHSFDKQLSLGYMNYVADINAGAAMYSKAASPRANWAIGMQFCNYGSFKETNEVNEDLGTFTAQDMALNGMYSYKFTDKWSGGITGKAIYSALADYTSFAIGVDLGLNYYDEAHNFSLGMALKNLGGQIVRYDNVYESLPFDFQIGLSKKLAHAPFRFHTTLHYMTVWDMSLNRSTDATTSTTAYAGSSDNFFKTLSKHCVFGVDVLLSKNFYIALAYNPKTSDDFRLLEQKGMQGFSFGTGFKVSRFNVSAAYYSQHVNAPTLMVGINTTIGKL